MFAWAGGGMVRISLRRRPSGYRPPLPPGLPGPPVYCGLPFAPTFPGEEASRRSVAVAAATPLLFLAAGGGVAQLSGFEAGAAWVPWAGDAAPADVLRVVLPRGRCGVAVAPGTVDARVLGGARPPARSPRRGAGVSWQSRLRA